ncbi:MAG: hypothetical protein AAF234_15485 [Pseudomonadota bacterium]
MPKGTMPAHTSKRFYTRYARTLCAIMVPAMMAGMTAGWMMSDIKGEVAPIHDLAQRVEMLRYAQTKVPTLEAGLAQEVRTSAVHAPVSDVIEVVR